MSRHELSRSSSSSSSAGTKDTPSPPSPPSLHTSTPARSSPSPDPSSAPRTSSPLNPHSRSQSSSPTPPSRTSLLPTPPSAAEGRVRLHSFAGHDPSPSVRDALIPISRVTSAPAVPQSSAGLGFPLPTFASDPPGAASSLFRPRSTSRSPSRGTSPKRGQEPDNAGPVLPGSTWWTHRLHSPRPWAEHSKRKRTVPPEQAEAYTHTRSVRRPVPISSSLH